MHDAIIGHYIAGCHIDTFQHSGVVYNPSTSEQIARCAYADAAIVDLAVQAAISENARKWAKASHATRLQVLFKLRELLIEKTPLLAEIIGREHGKTLADAEGEIGRAIEGIEFACNAPHITKGEYSRNVAGDIDVFSLRLPIGVVGCITPFNFPIMIPVVMTAMAVAVGNSIVFKPSEKVPSAAIFLAELWQQAGLPDGVFNVVQGDKITVDAMLAHPDIDAISFVGSTQVGEYVYQQATALHKRVAAFTGGKNHMVVMPDADLDAAANAFISAGFGSASQRCMAVSVLVPVGTETANQLKTLIIEKMQKLKVGAYNDPHADFGAVISAQSQHNILKSIQQSIEDGAELVIDGADFLHAEHQQGFYVGPTLFDHLTTEMDLYRQEVFGPVRGILRVETLDEAIAVINQHELGNGAVIFTANGQAAQQFFMNVEAGMIGVNVPVPLPVSYFNFGGLRRSRFGESHLYGPDAARFYTQLKTISQKWPLSQTTPASAISLAFQITT
ncbi:MULTISPECIES: CoA-acylating methylmalonate-semialdehyde dehydrogenase [unclassified Acinetobacter]|uniref:CoA-acylating methylmalonate-semialdehyde dehydrogenase n=1 Tax=unclassified Acinetobacter TaxID=196816 RepID=UPI002934DC28|nr:MULTISPECIES: CoA-acylating methylmalonate-semialdehyde dehydrogenase [unclassified Acinetobacter]WOE30767.1 CoA-acylating methylmalonate-semialdehyde dehydrogenase [Acinetobacter sp. SAAs470]WOE38960.1 CoA-acylating methylmalonate-semialdehyde dehydrogenase [Acinetobacter sp. SAAs474]